MILLSVRLEVQSYFSNWTSKLLSYIHTLLRNGLVSKDWYHLLGKTGYHSSCWKNDPFLCPFVSGFMIFPPWKSQLLFQWLFCSNTSTEILWCPRNVSRPSYPIKPRKKNNITFWEPVIKIPHITLKNCLYQLNIIP